MSGFFHRLRRDRVSQVLLVIVVFLLLSIFAGSWSGIEETKGEWVYSPQPTVQSENSGIQATPTPAMIVIDATAPQNSGHPTIITANDTFPQKSVPTGGQYGVPILDDLFNFIEQYDPSRKAFNINNWGACCNYSQGELTQLAQTMRGYSGDQWDYITQNVVPVLEDAKHCNLDPNVIETRTDGVAYILGANTVNNCAWDVGYAVTKINSPQ